MASRRGSARSRAIGKVKLGAKLLGLGDGEYRGLLDRVTGRRSAADLKLPELGRVIEEMERLGARFVRPDRRRKPKPPPEKEPLIGKIRALLADAGRPEEYAEGILRKMTKHEHRSPLAWATPEQLHKVVAALSYDQRRRKERGQSREKHHERPA